MTVQAPLRGLSRALLGAALATGALAASASAAPPGGPALRVAVAPIADRRTLAFPDKLPLRVDSPFRTLTAQPRGLPERLRREVAKALSETNGIAVVEAPELAAGPDPDRVRAVAGVRRLDAVVAGAVRLGFGQMQVTGFRRRAYVGRVRLELSFLSGRTGRPLGSPLVIEGSDEVGMDFRRMDIDVLHHRGAGPEARERVEEAVRDVGRPLRAKLSGRWLASVLEAESRSPTPAATARLAIERTALEPETLRPGRRAGMVIAYTMSGLAPGTVVDVTETRRLYRAGHLVAGPFRVVYALGNGGHTSVQELHVPMSAEAGRYLLLGVVEAAGARASGSGHFTIQAP